MLTFILVRVLDVCEKMEIIAAPVDYPVFEGIISEYYFLQTAKDCAGALESGEFHLPRMHVLAGVFLCIQDLHYPRFHYKSR